VNFITNSRDIGDRFEVGEQEKEVLEDELQQQMAYYEDLEAQYQQLRLTMCGDCARVHDLKMRH
jgi:hypothetical protein